MLGVQGACSARRAGRWGAQGERARERGRQRRTRARGAQVGALAGVGATGRGCAGSGTAGLAGAQAAGRQARARQGAAGVGAWGARPGRWARALGSWADRGCALGALGHFWPGLTQYFPESNFLDIVREPGS